MSRRGWNNVLIFSTLIMIFLFNGLHNKLFSNDQTSELIVDAPFNLYSIDFPGVSLQKEGQNWRLASAQEIRLSNKQLNALVARWQTLQGQPLEVQPSFNSYPKATASFWFQGQQKALVVRLYPVNGQLLAATEEKTYQLPADITLDSLLP